VKKKSLKTLCSVRNEARKHSIYTYFRYTISYVRYNVVRSVTRLLYWAGYMFRLLRSHDQVLPFPCQLTLPLTINTHFSVLKYKKVFIDKVTGVSEKPAASILLDSRLFRNVRYQSDITAPKAFAFIMTVRN